MMRESPEQFTLKKREYFVRLGLQVREAFKLHKQAGLWERKDGKRDWVNISEHCLVETARVDILAGELNLPEDLRGDLKIAAALHDFFKKCEKEIIVAEGQAGRAGWDSFEKASQESTLQMKSAGFSDRIIRLANSGGHGSLAETENILNNKVLSPEDLAYLILHYVDDYTIGSDWANPTESLPDNRRTNDLDRRIDKNETNPHYSQLNEDGKIRFRGKTTFEEQRRIGHLVEERLASILAANREAVDARDLPQYVDKKIQDKIALVG